jgi:hypothetical protein
MYGLLIEAVVEYAKQKYGESIWETVRQKAKVKSKSFVTNEQYSEIVILRIIRCLAQVTGWLFIISIFLNYYFIFNTKKRARN